jgi:NADPH-dependent curcumin reductase CurA
MATIGQTIGKVSHSFNTKLDTGEVVQLTLDFDFSTSTDQDIKSWLVSNRVISFQRPARTMKAGELKKLDKTTVSAKDVGKKVQSNEDKFRAGIAALRAVGMNDQADTLELEWNEKHQDQNEDQE